MEPNKYQGGGFKRGIGLRSEDFKYLFQFSIHEEGRLDQPKYSTDIYVSTIFPGLTGSANPARSTTC